MFDFQKFAPGQIWWANLESNDPDRVVTGKRPVIIVRRIGFKVIIFPITKSAERYLNVEFKIRLTNACDSFVMVENVMTIDEARLLDYRGALTPEAFDKVLKNFMAILNGDVVLQDGGFYYKDQYTPPAVETFYQRNDSGQLLSISTESREKKEEGETEVLLRKEEQERGRFSSKNLTEDDKKFILTHSCQEVQAAYGMSQSMFYWLRKRLKEEELLTENEKLLLSKSEAELKQLGVSSQIAKFYRRQAKTEAAKNII